jgi:carboxyl-terminal processing protease
MTKHILLPLLILTIGTFGWFTLLHAQPTTPAQQQAIRLKKVLEEQHYSPRKFDDNLSSQIFSQVIRLLDAKHLYFTQADIKELSVYQTRIDDELNGSTWQFLPHLTRLHQQRLLQAEKTCTEILQKSFTFSSSETLSFATKDTLIFAADAKEYQQRWSKWLKYQTLLQLAAMPDEKKASADLLAKEPQARQKVKTTEIRSIRRMLDQPDGYEAYVADLFYNAITACFDPHTIYLGKTDWQNFESQLSTESFSFGIDLEESVTGDVEIARLIPGGPAWKCNELHKGDRVISLQWAGKNKVDVSDADIDEVEALLASSNEGKLELTVRKTSGVMKTVSLIKEKLRADDNIVKSFILKGEKKIGYISLPGFYSEWENSPGQGCSNDVAKEVMKLKEEKIDGLILDIRYNGGGSLMEGSNLAGIFINEGPLFMTQGRDGKPTVMKDMNRGTIYDGPLVLMVNGQSASASEVLASTLQDYNRAVIVGSSTFGKASGQIIIPLDPHLSLSSTESAKTGSKYGFAAVTVDKLYRVTGKSAQLKGVQPHVHLPDIYENLEYREEFYPFALPQDSVSKKVVYTPLKALPTQTLAQKSKDRLKTHPQFQTLTKLIDTQVSLLTEKNQTIPLQVAYFKTQAAKRNEWWEAVEKTLAYTSKLFSVTNTGYDQELMRIDTYGKEINDLQMHNIQEDLYIEESFKIINDLILLNATNK